jgi:hypothetical protein
MADRRPLYRAFNAAVRKAIAESEVLLVGRIAQAAPKSPGVALSLLERRHPQRWGQARADLAQTADEFPAEPPAPGKPKPPTLQDQVISLSPEWQLPIIKLMTAAALGKTVAEFFEGPDQLAVPVSPILRRIPGGRCLASHSFRHPWRHPLSLGTRLRRPLTPPISRRDQTTRVSADHIDPCEPFEWRTTRNSRTRLGRRFGSESSSSNAATTTPGLSPGAGPNRPSKMVLRIVTRYAPDRPCRGPNEGPDLAAPLHSPPLRSPTPHPVRARRGRAGSRSPRPAR